MIMENKKRRMSNSELNTIVDCMKKNVTYDELVEADNKYKGLLIRFWRRRYPDAYNFIDWIEYMKNKDTRLVKKKKEQAKTLQEEHDNLMIFLDNIKNGAR